MPNSQKSRWVLTPSVIRAKPNLSCVRMKEQAISVWQNENETLLRTAQIWLISGLRLQSRSLAGKQARDLPQVLERRPSWDPTLHRQMASYKPRGVGNTHVGSAPTSCFTPYVEKRCVLRFSDLPEVTGLDLSPIFSSTAWFLVDSHFTRDQQQISFWAVNLHWFGEQLSETHHWRGEIALIQTWAHGRQVIVSEFDFVSCLLMH